MSITVTFNGQNYTIPTPNETGWGSNLDDYLVAIAAGALQKTGGSFTLSAEVDFGGAFGIKALDFKSRTVNPASTGVLRLANGDLIEWRNGTNTGDVGLTVNASNQLVFNGVLVQQVSLTSAHILVGNGSNIATDVAMTGDISIDNVGLTAIVAGSIINNDVNIAAAIDLSKLATVTIDRVLISNGSGVISASTITSTTLGFLDATSSIQGQLNTKAVDSTVVHNTGIETIAGTKSFTSPLLLSSGTAAAPGLSFIGDTNMGIYRGGADTLVLATTGSARWQVDSNGRLESIAGSQLSIANGTAAAPGLILSADNTTGIYLLSAGNLGFSTAGALALVIGSTGRLYGIDGSASFPTYSFNNDSDTGYFWASSGKTRIVGNTQILASFGQDGVYILGTITNDSASAGYVGEYISSIISANTSVGTSGQMFDLTSISLTAGDWDVSGLVLYKRNGATFTSTDLELGLSTTSGNSFTGLVYGSNALDNIDVVPTTFNTTSLSLPAVRISISSTTTHYLKGYVATYTSGTPQYICRVSARRVR